MAPILSTLNTLNGTQLLSHALINNSKYKTGMHQIFTFFT